MSEVFVENFSMGLGQVVGVFLGVVAGVAITIAVEYVRNRCARKQELINLNFELDVNLGKIKAWMEEITKWRNAINADSLSQYYGYFDLSSAIVATTNSLFIAGKLYNTLTYDHIVKLQGVFKDLSVSGEQYLNNQIKQKKQLLVQLQNEGHEDEWQRTLKPECAQEVEFWETKLKSHQASLLAVKEEVEKVIH